MSGTAGQFLQKDFFQNIGGLNNSDSPFAIQDGQATGGFNYDYVKTGGIKKSNAPSLLNTVANAQLRTLGLGLYNTKESVKTIIRAAGTKIQSTDLAGTFTNLTEDTTAVNNDFLVSGSEQSVVSSMFVTPNQDVLWLAGGGMTIPYGVASTTKVTKNGVTPPTGAISGLESGSGGEWSTTGNYRYAVAFRKATTQALSNVALDIQVAVTSITNSVVITLSGISNNDTTKYDKIYLYRSAVGGAEEFTTGDLVAEIASTATSYEDTGSYETTAENIPRAGNTILDNSELPAGTYNYITVWKRRLVAVSKSTIYISDLNKPESWPIGNRITVPTGGAGTGVSVIGFNTPTTTNTDEFLAFFKENELWTVDGTDLDDWELKFVDSTGCAGQPLIVSGNGYLYFIDNRGIYLWDGAAKPIYISRPIEQLFGEDGDLDKAQFNEGFGVFFKRQNEVIWYLPSGLLGQNKFMLKLDLRLTLPQVSNTLGERVMDGIFIQGKVTNPAFGGASFYFPTSSAQEEVLITGDDAGYLYRQFYSSVGITGNANDYSFTYDTNYLALGKAGITKQYNKVLVWVDNVGNWPLILDYWTDFRNQTSNKSSVSGTVNPNTSGDIALWDIAKWDVASWDGFTPAPICLVYNLGSQNQNNVQGEVIKLRFRNENNSQPITINGFSIIYSEIGLKK